MRNLKDRDFLELVAVIVQLDLSGVEMNSKLELLGWDSLSDLTFLAKVDEILGIELDADKLSKAATVMDLFQLISK